jgi:hypothetical protein
MIRALIPTNPEFKTYEDDIKKLYEKSQDKICDPNPFEFIRDNTFFYLFLSDSKLIGAIYYFLDEGKLYLNAFSRRKTFKENIECLKLSTSWFKSSIFAEAQNRASALCLLKAGFKRLRGNVFVYESSG